EALATALEARRGVARVPELVAFVERAAARVHLVAEGAERAAQRGAASLDAARARERARRGVAGVAELVTLVERAAAGIDDVAGAAQAGAGVVCGGRALD